MNAVRVTLAVDALMMMADNGRDVVVRVDLAENPFADHRVILHYPPLFQRKRALLAEKARRQPDLANVMDESAEICALTNVCDKPMRSAMSLE